LCIVVSNTFVLFVFGLCALCCCQFLILCFCFFVFFRLSCTPYVTTFSGFTIFDCPFVILYRLVKLCGDTIKRPLLRSCVCVCVYVCVCVCARACVRACFPVGQGTGVHPRYSVGFVLINLIFSAKYFIDRCCFVCLLFF
jgi:hypothetical protein